jgi:hypothetical protein
MNYKRNRWVGKGGKRVYENKKGVEGGGQALNLFIPVLLGDQIETRTSNPLGPG